MHPLKWLSAKVGDHPGLSAGMILGGVFGSVLGPIGTLAGVSAGAAIGNNLDQPKPGEKKDG